MTDAERVRLSIAACRVRMGVIASTHGAKAGHPGGSLSAADLFAYLYNKELHIDPANPQWEDRDRFVLSKGHTAPVDAKMRDFGFAVEVVDGHSFDELERAFNAFHKTTGQPTAILMRTTKGKGVSFMENSVGWHGKAPNDAEYAQAMQELNAALAQWEGEA